MSQTFPDYYAILGTLAHPSLHLLPTRHISDNLLNSLPTWKLEMDCEGEKGRSGDLLMGIRRRSSEDEESDRETTSTRRGFCDWPGWT